MLCFVLQMLLITLRDPHNDIDSKFFTLEVLDQRNKKPGWVQMTMAKYPVVRQLLTLAANVPGTEGSPVRDAQEKIAHVMGTPMKFSSTFHVQATKGAGDTGERVETSWEAADSDLAQVSAGLPKCFVAFMEMLHGVYAGEFDDEIKALAAEKSPKDTLQDDEALGGVSPTLQGKTKDALRLVASVANQYTACETDQTLLSVRSLKRIASEPDEAEAAAASNERAQVWDKAREVRKKLVSLQLMKQVTKAKIEGVVTKMSPSKLGDGHRLFVWSADMVSEAGPRPWKEEAVPKQPEYEAILDFMSNLKGPGDFAMCFDGRMRAVRRSIEGTLCSGGKSPPDELFVFYAMDGENSGLNKIFMGAKLHEVGFVLLPCTRQRLTVLKRQDKFLPTGADSTHCPMFANVPLPAATSFPRMSTREKATIFPAGCVGEPALSPHPVKWDYGGVPLFWRESKSSDLWEAVIDMFNVKVIVDFTPGSGALARAAMSRGLRYTGFVSDAKHLSWLQNTLDAAALRFIAKKGEHLYVADVAEMIAEHYQDLLEDPEQAPEVEGLFDDSDVD